jgi:ABC-2 type transport system permease protein
MLLTLVKNNFKLLLRNKIMVGMFTIFPILLITILSSAFSLDLKNDYVLESFEVGYSIEKGTEIEPYFMVFKDQIKEIPVTFIEMTKDEALSALEDKKITCYVELNDQKYTLYKNQGLDINTIIVETTLDSGLYLYDGIKELQSLTPDGSLVSDSTQPSKDTTEFLDEFINISKLDADPIPEAQDYYGIVQLVYIIWFGIASCITFADTERKSGVVYRIALSKANASILFLGRFIPTVFSLCFQVGIALITSTILLKINWGPYPLLSFGILLLEIIAISAFGTTISFIIKNVSLINIGTYVASFIFGMLGGCFQTYMYNVDESLAKWSPLYYINRTLVELSTKGYSAYLNKSIILLMSVIGLSLIIGVIYSRVRGYNNEFV